MLLLSSYSKDTIWIEEVRKEKISTEDGAKVLLVSHHSAVNIVSWYMYTINNYKYTCLSFCLIYTYI